MTFQGKKRGQVLFLEVSVLFQFPVEFYGGLTLNRCNFGAAQLSARSAGFLCLGRVSHTITAQPLDRGVLLTLCQAETTHSVAPLPGASCLISSELQALHLWTKLLVG